MIMKKKTTDILFYNVLLCWRSAAVDVVSVPLIYIFPFNLDGKSIRRIMLWK